MVDSTTLQVLPLQQIVLHDLSKVLWRTHNWILEPSESVNIDFFSSETTNECTKLLINHRENILSFISDLILPKNLKHLLEEAVCRLQRGYMEAMAWGRQHEHILSYILNPLTVGRYAAGHFINPVGQFDDLAWAKCFVMDETQEMVWRYAFACLYCFEDIIRKLWYTIRNNNELYEELSDYSYSEIERIWTFCLENKTKELPEEEFYYTNFYACGFHEAVEEGYEHGARFFWEHCSDDVKVELLEKLEYECMLDAVEKGCAGFVYFIYSILPVEEKSGLYLHTITDDNECIWPCLLNSVFCKSVINDIISFPDFIPLDFYELILMHITSLMEVRSNSLHKMFRVLWHHYTQVIKASVCSYTLDHMIAKLTDKNALDLVELIQQYPPH